MNEQAGNIAEVLQLDKYRRISYNTRVVDALVRGTLREFTPQEFMVLMYLLTHTIFVGKDRITIPLRYMLDGVWDGEKLIQVPIPLSKKTLIKTLKGLEDSGFIFIVHNKVVPGHGMMRAANTIIINTETLGRALTNRELYDGTAIEYPDAGFIPVVPADKQPD